MENKKNIQQPISKEKRKKRKTKGISNVEQGIAKEEGKKRRTSNSQHSTSNSQGGREEKKNIQYPTLNIQ
jgi:hypothetical protein